MYIGIKYIDLKVNDQYKNCVHLQNSLLTGKKNIELGMVAIRIYDL
jgi:hypothetical protein